MMQNESSDPVEQDDRGRVLTELEAWIETPMLVLAFIWFLLVILELVWTTSGVFDFLGTAIWIIFLGEFALRFSLAPSKLSFLRKNPITILALIAPAFRFLRVFRLLRLGRGLRLIRIVGTANRSINALRQSFSRRGLGYVLVTTVLVTLLGAAGMLAFEPADSVSGGFENYAHALWWTAMLIATMGSDFWPKTAEGRVLSLFLSFYGFGIFGYLTASFASFFVGQEAKEEGQVLSARQLHHLAEEVASLRHALAEFRTGK